MQRNRQFRWLNIIVLLLISPVWIEYSIVDHQTIAAQAQQTALSDYRLPFDRRYAIRQGPCSTHNPPGAIDYSLPWDTPVYAAQSGDVILAENVSPKEDSPTGYGKLIKIRHSDGNVSYYAHLESIGVSVGAKVKKGDVVGYSGNTTRPNTPFEYHLHFELRDSTEAAFLPIVNLPTTVFYGCMPSGINDGWADPCPQSGFPTGAYDSRIVDSVILYDSPEFGCDVNTTGSGHLLITNAQYRTLPFSFGLSSLKIPQGWSVTLFEQFGSGKARLFSSRRDLRSEFFNNLTLVNDRVGSVLVCPPGLCPNTPPNTPTSTFPTSGNTYTDISPTLCWNSDGDPDGDKVEFQVEIAQNNIPKVFSGWIQPASYPACWRPSQLDYQYGSYQWRVKARDIPLNAESSWSSTRSFTIEAPNKPPHVSLNTVNASPITGNFQDIWSNMRDWTFTGTATDEDGSIARVVFNCNGTGNCFERDLPVNGTTSWSYNRSGLEGWSQISFYAIDNKEARSPDADRHLVNLWIDLASPTTFLNLNGYSRDFPEWFSKAINATLVSYDQGTGGATRGVASIHYRVDGGTWQTMNRGNASFTVTDDGEHEVEYYAIDGVGNEEKSNLTSFKIDQTPPTLLSAASESQGVISDQWQKAVNAPVFTWASVNDTTSGLKQYEIEFSEIRDNGNVVIADVTRSPDNRQFTPGSMRTGTYQLRGRAQDNAGNWSDWATMFTFRYDEAPPENPSKVTHTAVITSDVWQRTTSSADFSWLPSHDEGSGVKGYYVSWGTDPAGTSTNLVANPHFQSSTPLCIAGQACTGYLNLRSVDNVDNQAEDWTTAFVLRYDDARPTVDFSFGGGITETTQIQLMLNITANDEGSGVRAMRFSTDGETWTAWEKYVSERPWRIPAISRQSWPVYMQVQDEVGLESPVVFHSIYLDVNPRQPRSINYRLFDHALSAGASVHQSANYTGHSTVGQMVDSSGSRSAHYLITGGYEAGSRAIPVVEPGHEKYAFINGIFASGSGATKLHSPNYQMIGTLGEPGLPNNETIVVSQGYQHQPGFLASFKPSAPLSIPDPGPAPEPIPEPACSAPQISINSGALYTASTDVTLSICAPRAVEMMIGNEENLAGSQWEPYATSKAWALPIAGAFVQPKFVYAAFRDTDGTVYRTSFDDIIYDPQSPSGALTVEGNTLSRSSPSATNADILSSHLTQLVTVLASQPSGGVTLYLTAQDDNSGIREMQVSTSPDFSAATWEPYSAVKTWIPSSANGITTLHVRFRDMAGNVSPSTNSTFMLDTTAPQGSLSIMPPVVGPKLLTTTLQIAAQDNLSGVVDMRISANAGFLNSIWQPYRASLTWPISPSPERRETLYIQYRDLAGNASQVFSGTLTVDTTPPIVYAQAAFGSTLTRKLTVLAYDELAQIATIHLSNDPRMIDGVVTLPYANTLTWRFDERRVVWIQVEDSVGNVSPPYPVFARRLPDIYLPLVTR